MEDNLLPEPRFKQRIVQSRMGLYHVQRLSTIEAGSSPGFWTRHAADRRNMCGSMRALLVGVSAVDWPYEWEPLSEKETHLLSCDRCIDRYGRWLDQYLKHNGLTTVR